AVGTTSVTSNWQRSRGCTGSTKSASTATAVTSHRQSSKQRSTLARTGYYRGLETNNPSLHRTQGESGQESSRQRAFLPHHLCDRDGGVVIGDPQRHRPE